MGVPMPPSSNHQYISFVGPGGKVVHKKSDVAKRYVKAFGIWALENNRVLAEARKPLQTAVREGLVLSVEAKFFFLHGAILTREGKLKQLDVSNRLKLMHDCLAETLCIDDKHFARVTAEKLWTPGADPTANYRVPPEPPTEFVDIRIATYKLRGWLPSDVEPEGGAFECNS